MSADQHSVGKVRSVPESHQIILGTLHFITPFLTQMSSLKEGRELVVGWLVGGWVGLETVSMLDSTNKARINVGI